MAILLHKLKARAPRLSDANAVTRLRRACDIVEDGVSHYTQEDLLVEWQRPGFNLASDAWAIINADGQFVGYASTYWNEEFMRVKTQACVHPDYRGRGVGTLLLRLAEVRARQFAKYARPGLRVVLSNMVGHTNQPARDLLEQEGYTLGNYCWRIIIVPEDTELPTIALDVAVACDTGTTRIYDPAGWYLVRQYDLYEKELRGGEIISCAALVEKGLVTV